MGERAGDVCVIGGGSGGWGGDRERGATYLPHCFPFSHSSILAFSIQSFG